MGNIHAGPKSTSLIGPADLLGNYIKNGGPGHSCMVDLDLCCPHMLKREFISLFSYTIGY